MPKRIASASQTHWKRRRTEKLEDSESEQEVLGNTTASKEEKPPVEAPKRKNGKADAANAQNDELDPQDDAALANEARKQERLALESQPINKARKWRKDIVATITAVRESQQESGTKTVKRLVPAPLQSEFAQLFSTRVIALTEMRLKMEDTLAASRRNKEFKKKGGELAVASALALEENCDRDSRVWKRTYDVSLNTASDNSSGNKKPRRAPTPS